MWHLGKYNYTPSELAERILRNKNIEIVTSDEILDCFEQNELSVYDFFENIYHKNGKNR